MGAMGGMGMTGMNLTKADSLHRLETFGHDDHAVHDDDHEDHVANAVTGDDMYTGFKDMKSNNTIL